MTRRAIRRSPEAKVARAARRKREEAEFLQWMQQQRQRATEIVHTAFVKEMERQTKAWMDDAKSKGVF